MFGISLTNSTNTKSTNNDIYMDCHSFAPKTWKTGTLKSLIERAILICSTEEFLNKELKHLEKVFREKIFSKWVIRNVMNEVKNKHQRSDTRNRILLIIIYQWKKFNKKTSFDPSLPMR